MKINLCFLLCLMSCGGLFAKLEDHFKMVPDKSGYHQMRNIDFIYMINLDERPEKFASCISQLRPYGIYPCRFSAVNGWKLSMKTINELGVEYKSGMPKGIRGTHYPLDGSGPFYEVMYLPGRRYFADGMAPGAIGCILSHLSILQDAINSEYKTIWVMEDDIEILQNPHFLSDLIDKMDALVGPDRWDVLFTDRDTKNSDGVYVPCLSTPVKPNFEFTDTARFKVCQPIDADLRKIGARFGTYSMIIRKSGMEKILQFIKQYKVFYPYDVEFFLSPDIQLYTVMRDVVSTQPKAVSDNRTPGYLRDF